MINNSPLLIHGENTIQSYGIGRYQAMISNSLKEYVKVKNLSFPMVRSKAKWLLLFSIWPFISALRALIWPGLIHVTSHYYSFFVPDSLMYKTVITCHDLILFKEIESQYWPVQYQLRKVAAAIKKANAVIAISNHVARDVESYFCINKERIHTVHLAVNNRVFRKMPSGVISEFRHNYGIPERPIVLYVGSEQPRKNIPFLFEAFAIARKKIPDLFLLKIGRSEDAAERSRINFLIKTNLLEPHVKFIDTLNDDDLAKAYNTAAVFAFPSIDEGFGFPPLEAMSCGTPVIASTHASVPEIIGNAGILVKPNDPNEWAELIVKVISDNNLQTNMALDGIKRAAGFSWDETARKTMDVYRKVFKQ